MFSTVNVIKCFRGKVKITNCKTGNITGKIFGLPLCESTFRFYDCSALGRGVVSVENLDFTIFVHFLYKNLSDCKVVLRAQPSSGYFTNFLLDLGLSCGWVIPKLQVKSIFLFVFVKFYALAICHDEKLSSSSSFKEVDLEFTRHETYFLSCFRQISLITFTRDN